MHLHCFDELNSKSVHSNALRKHTEQRHEVIDGERPALNAFACRTSPKEQTWRAEIDMRMMFSSSQIGLRIMYC